MTASPMQCPTCRKVATLLIDEVSPISGTPRRRKLALRCPTGCTPSREQLERLADPMAC
jgi:hypothetical protein